MWICKVHTGNGAQYYVLSDVQGLLLQLHIYEFQFPDTAWFLETLGL